MQKLGPQTDKTGFQKNLKSRYIYMELQNPPDDKRNTCSFRRQMPSVAISSEPQQYSVFGFYQEKARGKRKVLSRAFEGVLIGARHQLLRDLLSHNLHDSTRPGCLLLFSSTHSMKANVVIRVSDKDLEDEFQILIPDTFWLVSFSGRGGASQNRA